MNITKEEIKSAAELHASHPASGEYRFAIENFKAGVQWVLSQKLKQCNVSGRSEQLPDDYRNPLDDIDDPRTIGLSNGGRDY